MRSVLADTGPLYAALDPDDQYHTRAQQEIARLRRGKISVKILHPTVLECYTLALYRLTRSTAAPWLGEIMDSAELINPGTDDYIHAARLVASFADQSLTLFDATIAVVAGKLNLDVWTYDHHFDLMRIPVWR